MLNTLVAQLAKGPYLLGERFSAADVLWGSALTWSTMWQLVPELPEIKDYIRRTGSRPAVARAKEKETEIAGARAA
jgi:glutathione S-transferase